MLLPLDQMYAIPLDLELWRLMASCPGSPGRQKRVEIIAVTMKLPFSVVVSREIGAAIIL